MAEILGVSQQTISNYENSDIEPDIELLSRMADYFDTSIDYIVGRVDLRAKNQQGKIVDLADNEYELVTQYRALTAKERKCIDMMLDTLRGK